MKARLLLAALLLASSSRLFGLTVGRPVHHSWEFGLPVLHTKRITVTVVATPSPTQVVVHVQDKGDLLLTAFEPIQKRDDFPWVGLEISVVLHKNGQKGIDFTIVPVGGRDKWRIPIKSAHPCATYST